VKSTDIDYSRYTKRKLSDDVMLFWRILKDSGEIEVVLKAKSTTYVAIGWRPKGITASCKAFPYIADDGNGGSTAKAESEPKPEPKSNVRDSSYTRKLDVDADSSKAKTQSVAEPSANAEPGAKAETTPKAEPKSEPTPKSEHASKAEPEPKGKNSPEPEPSSNAEPTGKAEPEPASKAEPEPASKAEPTSKSEPASQVKSEPEPSGKVNSGSKPETSPKPEPTANKRKLYPRWKRQAEPEPEPEPSGGGAAPGAGPYTPGGDFHPMDCTDIVIGMARGSLSRIYDYYTRDRSTPAVDSFYGGNDDLTAAFGTEVDGETTIFFRKKLKATEQSDHTIVDGLMEIIWARGQEIGNYVHNPTTGLESGEASIPDFYRRDELKYHGHGSQRGRVTMNFYEESSKGDAEEDDSSGEWKTPKDCEGRLCEYKAQWKYNNKNDEVFFSISTNHSNKWTGIGFSKDTKMAETDAIIGWVEDSGRTFIMDTYLSGYSRPSLDQSQDIYNIKGTSQDGVVTIEFTRKRSTFDSDQDHHFTDTRCLYMVYPVQGASYNSVNKRIRKHEATPVLSTKPMCIRTLQKANAEPEPRGKPEPNAKPEPNGEPEPVAKNHDHSGHDHSGHDHSGHDHSGHDHSGHDHKHGKAEPEPTPSQPLFYKVSVKLSDVSWNADLSRKKSRQYRDLENKISDNVENALVDIPGFQSVIVTGFSKNDDEVVAQMNVIVDEDETEDETPANKIKQETDIVSTLKSSVKTGKLGQVRVNPSFLTILHPTSVNDVDPNLRSLQSSDGFGSNVLEDEASSSDNGGGLSDQQIKMYVIIAGVLAFVMLLVLQASCVIHRSKKKNKQPKPNEKLVTSGWKDYSTSSGNYSYENFAMSGDEPDKVSKHPVGLTPAPPEGAQINGNQRPNREEQRNPKTGYSATYDRPSKHSNRQPSSGYNSSAYATHDRSGRSNSSPRGQTVEQLQPDFYFMPSQRKYSGEVVRVYVDYNDP
ncbi:nahoda (predicted), partial [Pycnogonum litorale]